MTTETFGAAEAGLEAIKTGWTEATNAANAGNFYGGGYRGDAAHGEGGRGDDGARDDRAPRVEIDPVLLDSREGFIAVARVTEIVAASPKSFDDAIKNGIRRADSTLKNVGGAWVDSMRIEVESVHRRARLGPQVT